MYSAYYFCTSKLRFSSRSCGNVLRILLLYLKIALFELELRERRRHSGSAILTSIAHDPRRRERSARTTLLLQNCDFRSKAAGMCSAYYCCTSKLRFSSWSCRKVLRVLLLYVKTAIFEPLKKVAICAELKTAPQRERRAQDTLARRHSRSAVLTSNTHDPRRGSREPSKFARRRSESDQTRTIPAEGSPRPRQIRTAPQRERSDTHDARREFTATETDSHGAAGRAIRHARSPQRVHRNQDRFARRRSESDPTRAISAEGSNQICTAPQQERSDTRDPHRGFTATKTDSHGATARAPSSRQTRTAPQPERYFDVKHARSPQRVARTKQIRTAPQRERSDTHDPRRGFTATKTDSHGATARAVRHARCPQRVHRDQDRFARLHSDRGFTATKTDSHGTTARAIRLARSPQRVHRDQDRFARLHSECDPTRTIPERGEFR